MDVCPAEGLPEVEAEAESVEPSPPVSPPREASPEPEPEPQNKQSPPVTEAAAVTEQPEPADQKAPPTAATQVGNILTANRLLHCSYLGVTNAITMENVFLCSLLSLQEEEGADEVRVGR